MKATNNQVIDQFIIEASLVAPVSKIVRQLENGDFRDCDMKWLDAKLEAFTQFACTTLGMSVIMPDQISGYRGTVLNDYNTDRYLRYFNTLLTYFKTL